MSPIKKPIAANNIYTVILALAAGAVLATTVFVVLKCYGFYGTIFTVAK